MDEIIKVNDVSMRFNLAQEKTETLKEYTVKLLTHKLFFNEFYACLLYTSDAADD